LWYQGLFEDLEKIADSDQAERMSAYMQNRFSFLGVPKPLLKQFIKPFFQKSRKIQFDWDFVSLCWAKPYREAQYIAVDYILLHQKEFIDTDIDRIQELITHKSWWETVDSLDAVAGTLVLNNPKLKEKMKQWSQSDNMWLRRASIDFQLKFKNQTDAALLEEIINNNIGSTEFFINKAIGWSLRDYSKVNPGWVKAFLDKYKDKLSTLSMKEASKYL
jgi:3-methyladenine DNA glycosylase AlkD